MSEQISREQIQITRAFGILLVLLHHTINNLQGNSFLSWYLLFLAKCDVCIFFVISGYLFQSKYAKYSNNILTFLKSKIKQLMIPYLFWSLMLYIPAKIIHDLVGGQLSVLLSSMGFVPLSWGDIFWNTCTMQNRYVEYLWFLYALFIIFLLNIVLGNRFNRFRYVIVFLVITAIANYYLDIPYLLWKVLNHYGDFLVGRIVCGYLTEHEISYRKNGIIAVTGVLGILCGWPMIIQNLPQNLCVAILNTIVNHLLAWCVVISCVQIANRIQKNSVMGKAFETLGDYSFEIYLLHTPYVVPVVARIVPQLINIWGLQILVTMLMGVIVPMVVCRIFFYKNTMVRRIVFGR